MAEIIEKWRDSLIDTFEIKFKSVKLEAIVSYPHAGNDVFECLGMYNNEKTSFFLKLERSKMANFDNEVKILNLISGRLPVPSIYESGVYKNTKYIVMSKIMGEKLSTILKDKKADSNKYLFAYGTALAKIHGLDLTNDYAVQRIINDFPKEDNYKLMDQFSRITIDYLINTKPSINFDTFIHGDFHYSNVLWNSYNVAGILDWEYSGLGNKEQDIAWALILRPNQEFLFSIKDIIYFLNGYNSIGTYNSSILKWCLINGYFHFYLMNMKNNNKRYSARLKRLIRYFVLIEKI